jgi:hypothetical protein
MNKFLLFCLALFVLFVAPLEAQWYCWGQKYCWGCRRYMDPTYSNDEGLYYGYVDNINYPDTYDLPLNYYFNYCPPCRYGNYNGRYFQNCIHFSNQRYSNGLNSQ